MNPNLVHWTLPRWAAELFRETLTRDSKSANFDPKLREELSRGLRAIRESVGVSSPTDTGFDLFRLSKSKEVVDVSANTLRAYNRDGLPFYKQGKAIFVSKSELAAFIRFRSTTNPKAETE